MVVPAILLDAAGHHRLAVDGRARVESEDAHRRSDLRVALQAHLRCLVDGAPWPLDRPFARDAGTLEVALGPMTLGVRDLQGGRAVGSDHVPTPYESRFLADNGAPCAVATVAASPRRPTTDLHAHFAGCPRPSRLVRLAVEHGVVFTTAQLAQAGVGVDVDTPVSALPSRMVDTLARALSIPLDRQVTFRQLQTIYRLRKPVTKDERLFVRLLEAVVEDYAEMGVEYAEVSLHQIVDRALLQKVHRWLPALERRHGVQLRFLAAFGRRDDPEWIEDYLARVRQLADSRYIVGVDVMGHEVNSTRAFAGHLTELARWATERRPGFVVRVHAGENGGYPENIRVAAEAVAGEDVQLRIGHGLYGGDARTIDALRACGAIVEFNLSSNFALNNIQAVDAHQAPIRRYLDAGLDVVLGTDGYGIYQTDLDTEARLALMCGVEPSDLQLILRSEQRYLERRRRWDAHTLVDFEVPASPEGGRYGPHVEDRKRRVAEARDEALASRLEAIGAAVVQDPATLLRKKACISFAGAWKKSWGRLDAGQQAHVTATVGALLDALDPRRTVILAGGTAYGVEAVVQRAARARGFTVLGVLVKGLPPDHLQPGLITHAMVVGESLYDKAAGRYRTMKDHAGWCVFIGGGVIVSDEIQIAANLHLPTLLMDGPPGASTEHARHAPERAFRDAAEALARMGRRDRQAHFRYRGANPSVDVVVLRAPGEVLLIRRQDDDRPAAGAWALPGGFMLSDALPGAPWRGGRETHQQACLRELYEETGLDLRAAAPELIRVGRYEGGGRDPRDDEGAFSQSTAFVVEIDEATGARPISAGDDAGDARWFPLARPPPLAFDHRTILADALRALEGEGPRDP